ncbi:Transcriptional adapter 1, partial [Armadillidium nasatum]
MSFSSNEYLNQSRKWLINALGDKKDTYFSYMKQWFRMKVTKEEFDSNARTLLPLESIHLHNEFLLAILTKCQIFNSPSPCATTPIKLESIKQEDVVLEKRYELPFSQVSTTHNSVSQMNFNSHVNHNDRKKLKPRRKSKANNSVAENTFEPVSLQDITPTSSLRDPSAISDANVGYYSRSLQMLDTGHLRGRLLLAAWDHGLTGVNESVSLLLQEASKQCLKNIVTAVIGRRKGYRLREGKFLHSLGTLPPNPWLRNSASLVDWTSESLGIPLGETESGRRPAWPTVDAAEQNAAQLATCIPTNDPPLQPLSTYDLFATLQINKSVIPCHSVYALNMERISSRLWHPGWAELEQEAIAMKEATLKEALREQKMVANVIGNIP